jgi:hypothetical protein
MLRKNLSILFLLFIIIVCLLFSGFSFEKPVKEGMIDMDNDEEDTLLNPTQVSVSSSGNDQIIGISPGPAQQKKRISPGPAQQKKRISPGPAQQKKRISPGPAGLPPASPIQDKSTKIKDELKDNNYGIPRSTTKESFTTKTSYPNTAVYTHVMKDEKPEFKLKSF